MALASGSRTTSMTSRPARLQHLMMFWTLVVAAVMTWARTSMRTPLMPIGSLIWPWPSIMYSSGRVWMIWRSSGMLTALACSMTRATSWSVTSRFRMLTWPRLLKPRMWPPAMPQKTDWTSTAAICSASWMAWAMLLVVASMLTTTPWRRPSDGQVPTPMMSTPLSVTSPMMAATLVVPMSRPTMTSPTSAMTSSV